MDDEPPPADKPPPPRAVTMDEAVAMFANKVGARRL